MNFKEQVERIKSKLVKAKKVDKNRLVFGASKHNYYLADPADESDIKIFEDKYNITLPNCYRNYLSEIGNGGISYLDSAAGPFYGIYPLGKNIDELVGQPEIYLSKPVTLKPKMSRNEWKLLTRSLEKDNYLDDTQYEEEIGTLFGGILPIGAQGCTYIHGLVLNGENKGRVVNIDVDLEQPKFTYESNFLDWYERWLDEIISRKLINDNPRWFGYKKGGTEDRLISEYEYADKSERVSIIEALVEKKSLSDETYSLFKKEYAKESDEKIKKNILQLLFKFDPSAARPLLTEYAKVELLTVLKFIYWYDRENSFEWLDFIKDQLVNAKDGETFTFCTYILQETKTDYLKLILPYLSSPSINIRSTIFYNLGLQEKKSNYLDIFKLGLNDASSNVIHSTLQALDNVNDRFLLKDYKRIAVRFPKEKDYVLSNLNHRLKKFGINDEILREMSDIKLDQIMNKKWYEIWKK